MTLNQAGTGLMRAMRIEEAGAPLRQCEIAIPAPNADEVLIRVSACGVCRTDLHIRDGELAPHSLPLIPGHEVVGTVARTGSAVTRWHIGQRVGVPWLASTCRSCAYCRGDRENLCDSAAFTGLDRDGGYAQYTVAKADYCVDLPVQYDDLHVAPMLCAGLIGYRAYAMLHDDVRRIGIYGFGAAAHIITQVACHRGQEVFALTRDGDIRSQRFALSLGAIWAGDSGKPPPLSLDAALIFSPVGRLVPAALAAVRKGAHVICAGIHMSDIPALPYALLWGERCVKSVANLTRQDALAYFAFAARHRIETTPVPFRLDEANDALEALRQGAFDGAAVLLP
jgi:propanol-preferring alcohol dehydrogenase